MSQDHEVKEHVRQFMQTLRGEFQAKQRLTQAVIMNVTADAAGRAVSATAIIDGVSVQTVAISQAARILEGDVWEVENRGGESMPLWVTTRLLQPSARQASVDPTITLPTPTGLALTPGVYEPEPGGGYMASILAVWLAIAAIYGGVNYEVQYRTNAGDGATTLVTDVRPETYLDGTINDSQTIVPRDQDVAGREDDFPPRGRLQVESEKIDYTGVTSGAGDSGTGTGSTNTLADGTKSWTGDEWDGYMLTDSTGAVFEILGNNGTALTVSGTPASGAYTVKPAFTGCTRGAGSTTATTHADNTGVACLSVATAVTGLQPDTDYNFRVRAKTAAGAISGWSAWVTVQTETDDVAPSAPTGFAVADAVGGVLVTWTGPTLGTTPDLASFRLYTASDPTGTGATLVQKTSFGTSMFFSQMEYGQTLYFNLKAIDTSQNLSGYAVATWLPGRKLAGQGEQLLPNSDFERDFDGNSLPDGFNWLCPTTGGAGVTTVTWGSYGRETGKGLQVTIPYANAVGNDVTVMLYWPDPIYDRLLTAEVGQYYTASIHFKTNTAIGSVRYNVDDAAENDGYLYVAVMPIFHSGSVYDPIESPGALPAATYVLQQLSDGWYRISCTYLVTDDDVAGGLDYIGWAVILRNGTVASTWLNLDQAMLEMAQAPSEWAPCRRAVSDGAALNGILVDSGGIRTQDGTFKLGPDGKCHSAFLPAVNNSVDLGETTTPLKWRRVHLSDYLTADGGVHVGGTSDPGTDNLLVDGTTKLGSVADSINAGDLAVQNDVRVGGGVYAGGTGTNPATGTIVATDYVAAAGGVFSGENADPGTGNVVYTGDVKPKRSGTEFTGSVFVPLTTPLTNSDFAGDSFSDTSSTVIENTDWSTAIPAAAKALLLQVSVRDSASALTPGLYFALYPTSGEVDPALVLWLTNMLADYWVAATGIVPCTAGDIWYACNAGGTGTMEVYMKCFGYWL